MPNEFVHQRDYHLSNGPLHGPGRGGPDSGQPLRPGGKI